MFCEEIYLQPKEMEGNWCEGFAGSPYQCDHCCKCGGLSGGSVFIGVGMFVQRLHKNVGCVNDSTTKKCAVADSGIDTTGQQRCTRV